MTTMPERIKATLGGDLMYVSPVEGRWKTYGDRGEEYLRAATVVKMIRDAFRAGFNEAGEGWNGEYPCNAEVDAWLDREAKAYAETAVSGGAK